MMTTEDYKDLVRQMRRVASMYKEPPVGFEIEDEIVIKAADAIEELLESSKQNCLRVETPMGTLIAKESGFGPENPGVWIDIGRPDFDVDLPLALVEFTSDEEDVEGGHIITRVFGEAMADPFTHRIVHKGIEEYFKWV